MFLLICKSCKVHIMSNICLLFFFIKMLPNKVGIRFSSELLEAHIGVRILVFVLCKSISVEKAVIHAIMIGSAPLKLFISMSGNRLFNFYLNCFHLLFFLTLIRRRFDSPANSSNSFTALTLTFAHQFLDNYNHEGDKKDASENNSYEEV